MTQSEWHADLLGHATDLTGHQQIMHHRLRSTASVRFRHRHRQQELPIVLTRLATVGQTWDTHAQFPKYQSWGHGATGCTSTNAIVQAVTTFEEWIHQQLMDLQDATHCLQKDQFETDRLLQGTVTALLRLDQDLQGLAVVHDDVAACLTSVRAQLSWELFSQCCRNQSDAPLLQ